MLTPKQIEGLPENLVNLYAKAEADIIADMARRLSTYYYFIPAAEHQYKKIIEMGMVHDDILKRLSSITGITKKEIERLMKDAGAEAIKADDEIYKAAGLNPQPFGTSKGLSEVMAGGIAATDGLFENLTRTTANTATRQFEKSLDRAYMQIVTGAFDYNSSIRMAVKDLASKGVAVIEYPSGHVDYMEVAVRRAVVTGINQTAANMQETRADEMDSDLVETTAHGGARPEHTLWQGRVFSRSGKSNKYPDFRTSTGYGTGPGLCGWNCRHNFFPFFEGISEPAYTKEMLKEYNAKNYEYNGVKMTEYEASQKQRYIERQIRRWKRENLAMKASELDTTESASKTASWQETQKDFIKQTGLKRQVDREQIPQYGRNEARKAIVDAERYYQHWKSGMTQAGAPKKLADYYDMKYNNPKEYRLLKGYVSAVEKGDISPLTGFDIYKNTADQIEKQLVGLVTASGIEIKYYVPHFIDRIIGQASMPHNGKRMGVPVETAMEALLGGEILQETKNKGLSSRQYRTAECIVAINPDTGNLIQLNPSRRK